MSLYVSVCLYVNVCEPLYVSVCMYMGTCPSVCFPHVNTGQSFSGDLSPFCRDRKTFGGDCFCQLLTFDEVGALYGLAELVVEE